MASVVELSVPCESFFIVGPREKIMNIYELPPESTLFYCVCCLYVLYVVPRYRSITEMAIQHFLLQNKEAVLRIRDPVPF
jgi:hypothetical protein